VNATDYAVGNHSLQVTVDDGTKPWSQTLTFTVEQAVTGIALNKTALGLPLGGTETLLASVLPANAANKSITWTTSAPAVATVSPAGLVTGKSLGTADITATAQDGGFFVKCTVQVAASQGITLAFSDPGLTAYDGTGFTLSRSGSTSQTITLNNSWSAVEWRVDGRVRGTGNDLTVNATDYAVGNHTLQVTVDDGTKPWSKTLGFTISD
jgi:uncharacterized protein YjdB